METAEAVAGRRGFLVQLLRLLGWGGLGVWAAGSVEPLLRYLTPAVRYESPTVFKVGFPDDYKPGEVSTRFKDDYRLFVVRDKGGIYALLAACTHLGCTTNWFPGERLIKCPCHGTNFSPEGDVISGPAPEPLRRAAISLARDGRILVDSSRVESRPDRRDTEPFFLKG